MKVKDSIKWLESLKQQIGQTQHSDLWSFEPVIDEIIANLEPFAKPHGRLIDADELKKDRINLYGTTDVVLMVDIENATTIIEAEVEQWL